MVEPIEKISKNFTDFLLEQEKNELDLKPKLFIILFRPNIWCLPTRLMHPAIGLIGARSTPIIKLDIGICSLATCIQDPGAAHKSIHTRAV